MEKLLSLKGMRGKIKQQQTQGKFACICVQKMGGTKWGSRADFGPGYSNHPLGGVKYKKLKIWSAR